MKNIVDNGRGYGYRPVSDSLERHPATWKSGRVPDAWMDAYLRPIVILANGFPLSGMSDLDLDTREIIASQIAGDIDDRYDFSPDLPPVTIVVREGGLPEWRQGLGDLIACRCIGCGRIHFSYWLETATDVRRANRIERGHPAIPLVSSGVVIFYAGKYAGCHGFGDERPWDGKFWARALAG